MDGSTIRVTARLRGENPVIYVCSPVALGVSVKLKLIPWECGQ